MSSVNYFWNTQEFRRFFLPLNILLIVALLYNGGEGIYGSEGFIINNFGQAIFSIFKIILFPILVALFFVVFLFSLSILIFLIYAWMVDYSYPDYDNITSNNFLYGFLLRFTYALYICCICLFFTFGGTIKNLTFFFSELSHKF